MSQEGACAQTGRISSAMSETLFRKAVESSLDWEYFLGSDGAVLYMAAASEGITGYTAREFLSESDLLARIVHPSDRAAFSAHCWHGSRGPGSLEFRIVRRAGDYRWIAHTCQSVCADDGGILGIHVCNRDVTDQKRAEVSLRQSEERFRQVVENLYAWVWEVDTEGLYTYSSSVVEKLLGYTPEELVGRKHFYDLFAERDRETLKTGALAAFAGHKSFKNFPNVNVHKNGNERILETNAVPILHADGRLLGYRGSDIDVTEAVRAREALYASENRYRAFFDQGPDGVVILDPSDGRIVEFNDQVCRQLGYSRNELGAMRVADIEVAETEADIRNRMDATLRYGRNEFETRQRTKSGDVRAVHVTTQIIDLGSRIAYHCIWRDISGQKRAEKERDSLQEQLIHAQRMDSVGRLAGGVAHDFNNMLAVISGHTEMALELLEQTDPVYGDLVEIRDAAERSAELTRQLLAFARKQASIPKVIDLNETIEGMLKMLRRLIGEGIELAWMPGSGMWPVKIDPSQTDQILANLCVNARDAISDVGRIIIETERVTLDDGYCDSHLGFVPGDYVMLAVSDDGCGMSKETAGNIFEPFFTTKELGKGTGLGLSTVYGIVTQNHGFINVYSEPGRGSTFKIYFPRHRGDAKEPAQPLAQAPAIGGNETVLLVEDEPAILRIAGAILRKNGYNVISTSVPGEAIRLAKSHEGDIHLLLTDVVMPEMTGRELARRISQIHPEIRQIFMSGYTADAIAHHGVLDEGVHFIAKPFSARRLAAKVREALD